MLAYFIDGMELITNFISVIKKRNIEAEISVVKIHAQWLHCKKSDFRFVKSTVAKLKVKECNVLFSVLLFCIIFAKEIIFVHSSIMVLVCNMTFIKSRIHIIEWMCCELLYTQVVVLFKIGGVLFSYDMYFLHYWLCAGLGIFPL